MNGTAYPAAILTLVLCACAPSVPADSPVATPSVPTQTPSVTPTHVANVTCHELSLYIDPALASGYTCATIPASTDELEPFPEHTRITLQGYPLSGTFFEAHVDVYSIADYASLTPGAIPGRVADLGALTGGAPAPVFSTSFGVPLPLLPEFNAAEAFFAHYVVAPFASGSGIRFVTEYSQYSVPVNNTDLFYTFQGASLDGQHWVSVILPINLAGLPPDPDSALGGLTWEQFSVGYESYIATAVGQLEAATPASFTPTLDALDALVASIAVAP